MDIGQSAPAIKRKIFISYARRDGAELAQRLYDALAAAGHQPWMDRSEILGGTEWGRKIEMGIAACDCELALLTEGSDASEICRAEQLRCLDLGKPVLPLLVQTNAPRPIHLYAKHYNDFSDAARFEQYLGELLELLATPDLQALYAPPPERPNMAPALPLNFVARPEELDRLRSLLLGDDTDRRLAVTALEGMGGIGKSVLAAALCHDKLVQAAFPDGVLWITVGREPSTLLEQLKAVGDRLKDIGGYYETVKQAEERLRELLPKKSVLLVLDDVWETRDIERLCINAPRCRVLITTRDAGIALGMAAVELRLDVMTPAEGLSLLRQWTGRNEPEFDMIAKRLGYLPLALKLAGARMHEGMLAAEWLERFTNVSQIKLGRRSATKDESLQLCFELSTDCLHQDDRALYFSLGIYPEDVWVPEQVVLRHWRRLRPDLDAHEGAELLLELWRLALIERRAVEAHGARTISLHDLLRNYNREQLGEHYGELQSELLSAYNPARKDWHAIEHDGYLYDYLAYHLREAGAAAELLALYENQQWMQARVQQSGWIYDGYLSDLMQAWESVATPALQRQVAAGEEPLALADCARFALIRSSASSLAVGYVPELVAQVLAAGLWTAERALFTADSVPDGVKRVQLYADILETAELSQAERARVQARALADVKVIPSAEQRARKMAALAKACESSLAEQLHAESVILLEQVASEHSRYEILLTLAPQVSGDMRAAVLEKSLALADQQQRTVLLMALAPGLDGAMLRQALAAVPQLAYPFYRAQVYTALAACCEPATKQSVLRQALVAARKALIPEERVQALDFACSDLSAPAKQAVVREALHQAFRLEDPYHAARRLSALSRHFEDEQHQAEKENLLRRALQAAQQVPTPKERARAFQSIASKLEGKPKQSAINSAIAAACRDNDPEFKAVVLANLSRFLPEKAQQETVKRALQIAEGIISRTQRIRTYVQIHKQIDKQIDGRSSTEVLRQALQSAQRAVDKHDTIEALVAVGRHLSSDNRQEVLGSALQLALTIERENKRTDMLALLIPQLAESSRSEALAVLLATLRTPYHAPFSAQAYYVLAAYGDGEKRSEIIKCALEESASKSDVSYVTTMCSLAVWLSEDQLRKVVRLALKIGAESSQVQALNSLVPCASVETLTAMAEGLLAGRFAGVRARVLPGIARRLPEESRQRLLEQVLQDLPQVAQIPSRVQLMAETGALLGGAEGEQAMQAAVDLALNLESEPVRAKTLQALAAVLPGPARARAQEAADALPSPAALAPAAHTADIASVILSVDTKLRESCTELRESVLRVLERLPASCPDGCGEAVLAPIARSISEICTEWKWL